MSSTLPWGGGAPAVLAGGTEAPLAYRGVFGEADDAAHVLNAVDVGDDKTLHAHIQQLQDGGTADLPHPCQWRDAPQLGGPYHVGGGLGLYGTVLVVQNHEIQPRAAQTFHHGGAAGAYEGAQRALALCQLFF